MSQVSMRVDELVRTGRYTTDEAIAIAVTEADRREDPFLVMRRAALGGAR